MVRFSNINAKFLYSCLRLMESLEDVILDKQERKNIY